MSPHGAPCDAFDPWVRRERGQVGIWEFVRGGGVWKSWNLEIWKFGNLGTWKSGNLRSQQIPKIKILKIKIRSAQNVGKVWISREKILLAPIWGHLGHFFAWAEKIENIVCVCFFFSLCLQFSRFPDFQISRFPDAAGAGRRTLRSQPDPSSNAPRDQIRRKECLLRPS